MKKKFEVRLFINERVNASPPIFLKGKAGQPLAETN